MDAQNSFGGFESLPIRKVVKRVTYKIFSGVLRADSITNSSNHYSASSSCRFSHPGSTLWGTVGCSLWHLRLFFIFENLDKVVHETHALNLVRAQGWSAFEGNDPIL